jgi:hypothetical protein
MINESHIKYILDVTHIKSGLSNTLYTSIYNFKTKDIHQYY